MTADLTPRQRAQLYRDAAKQARATAKSYDATARDFPADAAWAHEQARSCRDRAQHYEGVARSLETLQETEGALS